MHVSVSVMDVVSPSIPGGDIEDETVKGVGI